MSAEQPPEVLEVLARIAASHRGAVRRAGPLRRPAPKPCATCPYRKDVPSGVWAASEYAKLPPFDRVSGEQPPYLFQCHQTTADDPGARVCAGWAAVHRCNPRGHELLALRLAEAFNVMRLDDLYAVATYRTSVPLWPSGAAAAAHGLAEIDGPGPQARRAMDKIQARRPDSAAAAFFDDEDEDDEDNLIWPDGEPHES